MFLSKNWLGIDIVRTDIGENMGIFVFAFTATGKSTVAKKYKNVIDMESTLYKYIGNDLEDESLKSTSRFLNE